MADFADIGSDYTEKWLQAQIEEHASPKWKREDYERIEADAKAMLIDMKREDQ